MHLLMLLQLVSLLEHVRGAMFAVLAYNVVSVAADFVAADAWQS